LTSSASGLGFGVYPVPPDETAATVRTALEIGYRRIGCAAGASNAAPITFAFIPH